MKGMTSRRISELLEGGLSRGEIARRLGLSKSTVSYHARRLGAPVDPLAARRYDWAAVQAYYDEGHSVRDCQLVFGFSRQTWYAAAARGAVTPRPHGMPLKALLVAGSYRGRHNLKARLIGAGVKQGRCESCGIREWRGSRLSMELHHVNGDGRTTASRIFNSCARTATHRRRTFSGRNARNQVAG